MESKQECPNVGDNIRKLRELRNYTQQYMAQALGISTVLYGRLEHSEDVSTKYLFKIAAILKTSVQKILQFDSEQYFEVHNNKELRVLEHKIELMIDLMKKITEKI